MRASQHLLRFTYKKRCIIKLNPNHQRYLYQADKLLLLEVSCPTSRRLYTYCFVYFGHPLTSHSIPLYMVLHSTSGSPSTTRTELFTMSRQVFKPISKLLERWQLSKVYRLLADRKPIYLTPINYLFPRRAVKRNRLAKLSVIPSLTRMLTTSKTLTHQDIFGLLVETSEDQ